MFDKEVDISKTYGMKAVTKPSRTDIMRKAATDHKNKQQMKVTPSQLKQIYALQKSLSLPTTRDEKMSYMKARNLIANLRFKQQNVL